MNEANPFDAAKRAALRAEIRRDGLLADKFLNDDPEVSTFGLNLACAWPFPEAWRANYERLANRLGALGPWVYAYPFPFTHVTLVTLVSFARHVHPSPELVSVCEGEIPEIIAALGPLFAENSSERIKPFMLQPQALVLSRTAGIMPLRNPDGEVARLRERTMALLQRNASLYRELTEHGLNVPGIIHSTVLRFRRPPQDLEEFLATFDDLAADRSFPPLEVGEVLLTSETKPYMRGGEILWRFKLAAGSA